jgi:hypothetical protein
MQDIISIALVGAASYTTLTRTFRKSGPDGKTLHHAVTSDAWESLCKEVNPSTGHPLFILTEELPKEVEPVGNDLSAEDLQDDGDMNTIISPIANEDLEAGPGDLSDLDDDEAPVNPKIVVTHTPSTKPAAKTVTIGKAYGKGHGKSVQV